MHGEEKYSKQNNRINIDKKHNVNRRDKSRETREHARGYLWRPLVIVGGKKKKAYLQIFFF